MINIVDVSLFLILFGIICVSLFTLFQRLSLNLRGKRFEFYIGRRVGLNHDWGNILLVLLVILPSFYLALLIMRFLAKIG